MYAVRNQRDYETLYDRIERAIRLEQPITFTYKETKKDPANPKRRLKDQFEITVRTIEPYEIAMSAQGKDYVRSLDRLTQEPRSWRLDRILTYSPHRGVRVLDHAV